MPGNGGGRQAGIELRINGRVRRRPSGTPGAALLRELGVEDRQVVVEVDGVAVPRGRFEALVLARGTVEVVTYMGGIAPLWIVRVTTEGDDGKARRG